MKKSKKWLSIMSGLVATAIMLTGCGGSSTTSSSSSDGDSKDNFKGKTLNLLTWEGYGDPKIIKDFEKKYDVKVNATYFGSSDELVAKLKSGGGSTYDIISPSGDVAGMLVDSDMVEPINVDKFKNFKDTDKRLQLEDVEKDGKIYGVPYAWGPSYLIYDADVIKEEPKSWNVLYDKKYKGKVGLVDDVANIYMMGQLMGLDKKDNAALYNMTESQLQTAKEKLLKLKPQVRKFWATGGELNDLFANREVVLSMGWPLTVKEVNDQGRNLKWTIPQEGATGWVDRLMIVKGSKNRDLAELYLDYALSPKTQVATAKVTNYCVSNPKSAEFMSKELQDITYVNNMDEMFDQINFWQYVKDRARYNEIWTEVKTN